jgi:hypothetical protein
MFYSPYDTKFTLIIKHLAFWSSLLGMFALFVLLFNDNAKIPQKETVLKLDVKNQINICLPTDEKIFKKSFFDF